MGQVAEGDAMGSSPGKVMGAVRREGKLEGGGGKERGGRTHPNDGQSIPVLRDAGHTQLGTHQ